MKIFQETTSKHKYLEEGQVQGNSKKIETSDECPKNNNLKLVSRHQVSNTVFLWQKARTSLSA